MIIWFALREYLCVYVCCVWQTGQSIDGKKFNMHDCLMRTRRRQRKRVCLVTVLVVVALVSSEKSPHTRYYTFSVHLDPINTFFLGVSLSLSLNRSLCIEFCVLCVCTTLRRRQKQHIHTHTRAYISKNGHYMPFCRFWTSKSIWMAHLWHQILYL